MEAARRSGKKEDDLPRRGRARVPIKFRECFSVCLSRYASGSICTLVITFWAVTYPHRGRLEGRRGCPDWWASPSSLSFWREHWRAGYRGRCMGISACKSRISTSHGSRNFVRGRTELGGRQTAFELDEKAPSVWGALQCGNDGQASAIGRFAHPYPLQDLAVSESVRDRVVVDRISGHKGDRSSHSRH